jgi:predicted ester cyclase
MSSLEQDAARATIAETAMLFFDACESGRGWEACRNYCQADAGFSAQADALADIGSLEAYTEWMKGLLTPVPDAHYEIHAFAEDAGRNKVLAFASFIGTHTGEGGPVPPTGRRVNAEYVYVMEFEGGRICHMTKIWNDAHSLKQLGWA